MKIADYRHLVSLQNRTQVSDNMGSTTGIWSDVVEVYAALWPIKAGELTKDGKLTMEVTHKIKIRYYPGVLPGWRILFGTRTFDILSIVNPDERNITLDLVCREEI